MATGSSIFLAPNVSGRPEKYSQYFELDLFLGEKEIQTSARRCCREQLLEDFSRQTYTQYSLDVSRESAAT